MRRLTVELPVEASSSPSPPRQTAPEENGGKASAAEQGDGAALREGLACAAETGGGEDERVGAILAVAVEVGVSGTLPSAESALNLRDGGFAPGEEGCGRDEEL